MAVTVTDSPSTALPGSIIGRPIRLPHVMLCTQGERWCGWVRCANDRHQLVVLMAERRSHEEKCGGGLIIAT
jgi:hypothetical protein